MIAMKSDLEKSYVTLAKKMKFFLCHSYGYWSPTVLHQAAKTLYDILQGHTVPITHCHSVNAVALA